jgi:hypothetical protein
MAVAFTVNGTAQSVDVDANTPLLWVVREHLKLTGTKFIATNNPPTGMGEVGIPTVAPAIGNAVAQLTGKRLRHLPMSADRVKKALA